ncbi:MAG: choice-of-anchor D domain-containing protein [Luteolibacter sp.]|uniref:choice-of-anchor D domain-containing protein n=1 Tax=Luteolibacter sp. TaxID=1962973 RepID=UPI0032657AED
MKNPIPSFSKPPGTLSLLATVGILLSGITCGNGQVALLTGDYNNAYHPQDSTIQDLSADGDLVLFTSGPPATGSTPGITEGGFYVRRISTNSLTFVGDTSVAQGGEGSFSDDGRYLCWRGADNFIYWRDSVSDITRLITPAADGASRRPVMSADGRYVAYASVARNIVSNSGKLQPAGKAGAYLYDSVNQTTIVASLNSSGKALDTGIGVVTSVATAGNEFDLSADGKYLVFSSDATNVSPARPSTYPASLTCIYRRNLSTGAIDLLNKTTGGGVADGGFSTPRISANGGRVSFFGAFVGTFGGKRLIDSVSNGFGTDLYVKDAGTGDLWWATKTTDNSVSDGSYLSATISGNGLTVAFGSTGTKFVTANTDPPVGNDGLFDVFRVDLASGGSIAKTTLVTNSPNGSGNVDFRYGPFLPGNASYTAFCTSQIEAMLGTGSNDSFFSHGFSIVKPSLPKLPEIVVLAGIVGLTDNSGKVNFGTVKTGKSGTAKIFTIKNIGTATLQNLALKKSGAQQGDFTVTALTAASLSGGGASTIFKVTFKPKAKGARNAVLKIVNNDANENPFDIKLTGTGAAP